MKSMIELAARIAAGGDQERNFRLGCVAKRKDGAVVVSTNAKTRKPNPEAHAEARCLKKSGHGATLWIARINKDGSWTMARPCPKCAARIKTKMVERVFYTIGPGEWGCWKPQKEELNKEVKKITFDQHTKWCEQ